MRLRLEWMRSSIPNPGADPRPPASLALFILLLIPAQEADRPLQR
jgi:hypothetical protein